MKLKLLFLVLLTHALATEEQPLGVFYFSEMFGQIHQFPSIDSIGLTTVACGHPIKVYPMDKDKKDWKRVKVVGIEGYILSRMLKPTPGECFQGRYSDFFNALDLSVTDMYYFGRLPELYIRGRSKVGRR